MEIKQLGAGDQGVAVYVKTPELGLMPVAGNVQNRTDRVTLPAVAQTVQDNSQPATSALEFSIDKESGRVVVKIIDSATQELVRQIPMEEMLVLAKALGRLKGLFFYTKA